MKKLYCFVLMLAGMHVSFAQNWLLNGNSGTNPSINFLGTTDANTLIFKVNNQLSGQLDHDSVKQTTSFGYQSLYANTVDGYGNTATGYRSLFSNTIGYDNTANGANALRSNTTGGSNTAAGNGTLYYNSSGVSNTAVGSVALYNNLSGRFNNAVGVSALYANETGEDNNALGLQALFTNRFGKKNTGIGTQALVSSDGNSNTAVGYKSLLTNTTGSFNTALGANANVTQSGLTNATAIGYNAKANASNKVRIGNTSVTSIGGQVNWTTYSDERVKRNIQENVPGLAFIQVLRPVTYRYNIANEHKLMNDNDETSNRQTSYAVEKINFTGLIAQEVDAAAKKINYDFSGVDKSGNIMGLRYAEFVVPLIKAVQELAIQNDVLKNQLAELQYQVDLLKAKYAGTSNTSTPGINDMPANKPIVYPNPAKNTVTINYTAEKNGKYIFEVTGISGTVLLRKEANAATGTNYITLDVSRLVKGVYFVNIIKPDQVRERLQLNKE